MIIGTAGPPPNVGGAVVVVVRFPDEVLYPSEFLWPGGDVVLGSTDLGLVDVDGAVARPVVFAAGSVPAAVGVSGGTVVSSASIAGSIG